MKSYRGLYEKATGIGVGADEDVHHIDLDRSNNSIHNLVKLKKSDHKALHRLVNGATAASLLILEDPQFPGSNAVEWIRDHGAEYCRMCLVLIDAVNQRDAQLQLSGWRD